MDMRYALDLNAAPAGYHHYCDDVSINFQCNRWMQWASPEARAELRAVSAGPGTYPEWIDTFFALAADARAAGRAVDAAYFDRGAEFFLEPGDPRKKPARRRIVDTLRAAFGVEPVAVPFADASLPAYELRPEGEAHSTWVLFGGFDSYVEEWFPLIAAAVRLGRRVIVFDGPGQGGALEDEGMPMIAEWERPVSAVLDHFGLDDVTLIGASLGGELVVRAAAFEPRVARVVAFDAMDDFLETTLSQTVPRGARAVGALATRLPARWVSAVLTRVAARKPVVSWGLWQGMHVTGTTSPAAFLRAIARMRTTTVSARVRGDVLLLQGADDHYVPVTQLARQARTLTGARSVTTRSFTAAESASSHCQIGNVGLALITIASWEDALAARVPATARPSA
ncbi:alpha/beta fold hydrolase [Mycetocola reblochoni]|uniref:AB hydrolase-1 domain-containing protein n=2 Tax=Mycetocola reblochoni TaxID=331618 RepID=A0A1R4IGW4_9MICO|nr:alpha/beta fold hydrolase [Mycetocola reblochoni]RLP69697.1 alpha/beta fold hydrolase [Mycetocola reblochoni]SJN19040.1 hypothetical protein FM119_01730 [Mycetocola reblochoni REB411]